MFKLKTKLVTAKVLKERKAKIFEKTYIFKKIRVVKFFKHLIAEGSAT